MSQGRFLAVDQGNTLLKLTLFEGDEVRASRRFPADALEDVFSVLEEWRPDCGAFCSVGKIDPRLVESLRIALDGQLLILSHSTPLPVKVDYSTPSTLGLDRVVLAAGAAGIYEGEALAVVDAGTAVTLDVVDPRPAFVGGRITAGLRLRFESLHQFTAALPLVGASDETPVAGDSTGTSIRSGVVLGLSDEITETFRQYKQTFGCKRLVLTGGDAEVLAPHIRTRIPADHVADLMARGLLYIYKYNE